MTNPLHPVLARQMKRAGFVDDGKPATGDLLTRVSRAYADADQDHYTMERSLEIVSAEMEQLNGALRRRSQAIHGATLEASIDGVIVVDANRRVIAHNRRLAEIFGLDEALLARGEADPIAAKVTEHLLDANAARVCNQEINQDPTLKLVDELNLIDGRVLERTTGPVNVDGVYIGRVWFFRDITAAKLSELALRDAKDAAEAATRAKDAFLANMSHEMRTPLNSILGFSRLISEEVGELLNVEQRENFALVVNAAEHLLSLVNDLLDLRSLKEVPDRIQCQAVRVDAAITEAVSLVRPLFSTRQHSFEVDLESCDLSVRADKRALIQVVVNLLSNAAKFTPPGGRIVVEAARRGAREGDVEIVVRDNGVGISEDAQTRLFTYFSQVNGRTDHGFKGSGIGLALTRSLVERMDGSIIVNSAVGVGSAFHVNLKAP